MVRVLVIDDEPDVLLLCRVNLQHAGHEVVEAQDGADGLTLAQETAPDVIVLDLMLPAVDGYEVLHQLREDVRTRDVPVLVLTAKVQLEDRLRCWQDGAAEFVTKPFSPELLTETLDRLIAMTPRERARRRDDAIRELSAQV
jgi:CheY-like chemotaxis protein